MNHCRACGQFLPGAYVEHGVLFCRGACLDWFLRHHNMLQRLLPLSAQAVEFAVRGEEQLQVEVDREGVHDAQP